LAETAIPIDLAIFIPKYEGADTPEPFRPLQHPDVIRRKQQDLLVIIAAPKVYPVLSTEHAAGSTHRDCATGIHNQLVALDYGVRVQRTGPGRMTHTFNTEVLTRLLGSPAMQAVNDVESEYKEHEYIIRQENPTDKYLQEHQQRYGQGYDQMKANEMLCVRLLVKVLQALHVPQWIVILTLARLQPRGVRIRVDQYIGLVIWLARSLGMGGPAVPMFWDIAYDVVVTFIQAIPGVIGAPTYADDMQLVGTSLRSLACTQTLMLWFQSVSGLAIAQHSCMSANFAVHRGQELQAGRILRQITRACYASP